LKSVKTDADRGGFQEIFNTSVAKLGAVLQSGMVSVEAQTALREASVAAEATYSGVSHDAEAAKLIEQQQAYQASARILATAREIFNTLVQSL
jgi:flagellar hook-associated protein 1 FlgK